MHPENKVLSTAANPRITVVQPGNYAIELRVQDGHGGVGKSTLPLLVGNAPPRVRFLAPQEGDFFTPGKPVAYKLLVEDEEDGSSAAYEELMEARTFVSARWRQGEEREEIVEPGLAMMRQNDCFNCHAVNQKIVGPALLDIANKYRDQAGALDASVQRVLKGSSRVWSDAPMLAHEQLTTDQIQLMVRWIYSLEPGKAGPDMTRGLTGTIAAPEALNNRIGILEASYTDAGRPPVGSLVGKATVTLRNRRVEAEESTELSGAKVQGADHASGRRFVRANADGDTARYASLNLADAGSVTCRVASAKTGGTIELHRDSAKGEVLARIEVKPTGAWNVWTECSAPMTSLAQRCDLVAVFHNPGQTNLLSLDWIQVNLR